MNKTQLLYYENPYQREFSANIISVEKNKDGTSIVLDKTLFFPEGGGQPGDRGMIGPFPINNTRKKDGIVYHFVKKVCDIMPGKVNCSIDWNHRFDYMQQHTGQHIISGVLYNYGYDTISVHQGKSYTSIEVDKSSKCSVPITIFPEELNKIEADVNRIICKNFLVKTYTVTECETEALKLRRAPKVKGAVRIVEIENYDRVACGGVHTLRTGEIIFAKVLFTEKIRGRVRIAWKIGDRVFEDYRAKLSISRALTNLFSVPEEGIVSAAKGIVQENNSLKTEIGFLLRKSALNDVDSMFSGAVEANNLLITTREYINKDKSYIKLLLSVLPQDEKYAFCFINRYDGGLQWALAVTIPGFDFSNIKEQLLSPIDGRGGGKAPFFQGIGKNINGIDMFFKKFRRLTSQF